MQTIVEQVLRNGPQQDLGMVSEGSGFEAMEAEAVLCASGCGVPSLHP